MEKKSAYEALMDAQQTFCRTEGYMEKKAFPALIGWGARLLPRLLPYAARAGQAIAGWAGRGASAIGRGVGAVGQAANGAVQVAKAHPFVSGMVGQQVLQGMIDNAGARRAQAQEQPAPAPAPAPVQPAPVQQPAGQGGRTQMPVISDELAGELRKWVEEYRNRTRSRYTPFSGYPIKTGLVSGIAPYQYQGYSNPLFQQPTQAPPYNGWTPRGTYINGRLYTGGMMGGDDPLSL